MRRPIATALRLYRQQEGLTQSEVARRTGIAQGEVSRHEGHDTEMRESTIERYAAGYGMDPLEFLLVILQIAKRHGDAK